MNNLGKKLKEKREEKQISLEELAQKTGLSKFLIAQYEEEECEYNASNLTKITDELEIDFWEICDNIQIMLMPEERSETEKQLCRKVDECANRIERESVDTKIKLDWIINSSKEEVLDRIIKGNKDLNVRGSINKIILNLEFNIETMEDAARYKVAEELRESIYLDIRKSVIDTIDYKIKEAESKYSKIVKEKLIKSCKDNVINVDFTRGDRK